MTNIAVIENKISAILKYLKILESYRGFAAEKIEKDATLKGALERYLYLAIQAAIDLGEAVIAFKKFRKPMIYGDVFGILQEEKIIAPSLAHQLKDMAGFRNILAHDYAEIDFSIVYDILKNHLQDITRFVQEIQSKIIQK